VPQIITQEVVTQVPSNHAEQRIVQTGVELERRMDRDMALQQGNIVLGQAQYAGNYVGNMTQAQYAGNYVGNMTGLGMEVSGMGGMGMAPASPASLGFNMYGGTAVGGGYAGACGGYPGGGQVYGAPQQMAGQPMSMFDMLDRNGDGVLTREELNQGFRYG